MKNKERWREYNKRYHAKKAAEDPRDYRTRKIFYMARARAASLGLSFDIDLAYLNEIPAEICPVFKVPLEWGTGGPHTASLDKIYPDKGYVKGNVQWICLRANILKRDSTKEENAKLYEWFQTI